MSLSLSPSQRFWRLLKPDQREIWNVYIYSIFNGLVGLSLPLGIQAIVNLIQGGQISTSWVVLVSFVVLGVVMSDVLQISQLKITENLQQKIFTRAAFEFAYRIPRIRLEALYQHYAPELMNRFFDIISVQKGLSKILIDFSTAVLRIAFGLLLLSIYHPFFVIFSLILLFLVVGILMLTLQAGLRTSLTESKYKYQVAHWLQELARTSTTFKLAGRTELPLNRADGHLQDYLGARNKHFGILIRQYSLMVLFKGLVTTGLLVIGGILVMNQTMNIGQFVAAEIIILSVMASVEKLFLSLETIYDVLTALEKIAQVTDMELEKSEGVELMKECKEGGIDLELDKVTFSYPGQKRKVLNELEISIKAGENWFISGLNGGGKSTLLHIMAGLYDVQEGSVIFHGFPKGNLELTSLRSIIGDCLAQEQLFDGTVLENIMMGREAATFENVKWAIKNLKLESFIKNLPEGYHTILGSQGKKLPQSIVQKLLLARSVVDKPKLLLFEDAFNHLDEQDRRDIIDFLTSKDNKWTMVSVSLDSYLAERSDRIAIMHAGRIIRTGTYAEMNEIPQLKRK